MIDNDSTFVFNAKVPKYPFRDDDGRVIEDDFTKRISLCKTINDCLQAIEGVFNNKKYYLYGIDLKSSEKDNIDVINLSNMLDKCPVINSDNYGEDFNMADWLDSLSNEDFYEIEKMLIDELKNDGGINPDDLIDIYKDLEENKNKDISDRDYSLIESPSSLPEKWQKIFYACVPDADKNNEFWSLKNLKMDYLGELNINNSKILYNITKNDFIPNVIKNIIS